VPEAGTRKVFGRVVLPSAKHDAMFRARWERGGMIETVLERQFAAAGCRGRLAVMEIDGPGRVAVGGDELAVAASSFKIAVGLELFCRHVAGQVDLGGRLRLLPEQRTPGGQGFCLFEDEVEVSLRDAARMMLTISDNTATDAVIRRVGSEQIAARLRALGLERTEFSGTVHENFDAIGRAAGLADHDELMRAFGRASSPREVESLQQRFFAACSPLSGCRSNTTTAEEMARLVRLIWRDEAGPAEACAALRAMMGQQKLTRKMANGFADDVRVAAKSGTIGGVVSNDVGAVQLPDGRRYAVAVLTEVLAPGQAGDVRDVRDAGDARREIDVAIGAAARLAVEHLQAGDTA
jgi:beta-lactamase class A